MGQTKDRENHGKTRVRSPEFEARIWKKGQCGNPAKIKQSPIKRALRNLTIETYREVIQLVLTGNLAALQIMIDDPVTPAIQVGVAKAFKKAIDHGDYTIIEKIAERIVGKIPDVVIQQTINSTSNNKDKVKAILDELARRV
jgi:ribosomal protein L25 (general stress protein Ctc)